MPEPIALPGYSLREEPYAIGGMGKVYLGKHLASGETHAVKIFDPANAGTDAIERYLLEARLMAELDHPHIVKLFDVGQLENEMIFMTMEYLPGGDLETRRKRGIKENTALEVLIELAHTLDYLHRSSVIHNDIKPANILFRDDGSLALIDFGLASRLVEGFSLPSKTKKTICSADYCSPEQAQGCKLDQRSDIYSLGVVFLELLTDNNPFRGDTTRDSLLNRLKMPVPLLSGTLSRYQPLLEKLLAKDPKQRFSSMDECLNLLDRIMMEATGEYPAIKIN